MSFSEEFTQEEGGSGAPAPAGHFLGELLTQVGLSEGGSGAAVLTQATEVIYRSDPSLDSTRYIVLDYTRYILLDCTRLH